MTRTTSNLLTMALSLIAAASFTAQAQTLSSSYYVDDQLDLVDAKIEESAKGAVDLMPLAEGLEPAYVEPANFEPDYLGDVDAGEKMAKGTGPLVGTNYIRMYISDASAYAGSGTDYVYVRFGQKRGDDDGSEAHQLRLYGYWDGSDNIFPRGWTLTWDLAGATTFFEDLPQDAFDEISIVTPSGDGILVHRLVVVHSSMEILDWTLDRWLDSPSSTTLGCAAKITERKLDYVSDSDNAALHFGAMEMGKTDGYKYGDGRLWCSEFASWALWKEGFMTPAGSFGTDQMKAWFSDRGRLYTRSQVTSESYVPQPGDYLSINSGNHSCLFLRWIDSTDNITNSTRFLSLDGNWGQTVTVVERTVSVIDRVGRAQ